jgi:hypothetical protein
VNTSSASPGTPDRDDSGRDDPRPVAPQPPDPADCCGDGCMPCIYDTYDEALSAYRSALAAWRARHPDAPA